MNARLEVSDFQQNPDANPLETTRRIHYENIFWIVLLHAMIFVAIPFFSWDALAVALLLLFTMGPIGVTMTFHRLLSHRAFKVPKWLEYTLATVGAACGQGPIMIWVAEHRLHHRYSDQDQDPHDSRKGFWFAHVGHLFFHKRFEDEKELWMKYVPDMASQKYYCFLNSWWPVLTVGVAVPLYFLGGWSYVLWGGFMRALMMLHITWFVNSAAHCWGYRNFETKDQSRNNWWVAILAAGEGWHNNHHAQQASASHGMRPWEFDLTFQMIRFLEWVGLATEVKRPSVWSENPEKAA